MGAFCVLPSDNQIANRRGPNIFIGQAEATDYQRLTPPRAAQPTDTQALRTFFVFFKKKFAISLEIVYFVYSSFDILLDKPKLGIESEVMSPNGFSVKGFGSRGLSYFSDLLLP